MQRNPTKSLRCTLAASVVLLVALLPFASEKSQSATMQLSQGKRESTMPPLPAVVDPAGDQNLVREAYYFVGTHPDVTQYVPCFCNYCKTDRHKSIRDCYVKAQSKAGVPIKWNEHAAECYVCLSVVAKTQLLYTDGKDLEAVVREIDSIFKSKFKYRTDTPLPPSKVNR
jgi:hypothetical protein